MDLKREKISIRKYQEDDYRFCYALLKRNMLGYIEKHQGGWDPARYRRNFIGDNIRIIEYNKKRIAYYNVEKRKSELILMDMQVSRPYRGHGLGTYLIGTIERQAEKAGMKKVILGVYWNNPSISLYKRSGYKIEKRRKTHAVMSKDLALE